MDRSFWGNHMNTHQLSYKRLAVPEIQTLSLDDCCSTQNITGEYKYLLARAWKVERHVIASNFVSIVFH